MFVYWSVTGIYFILHRPRVCLLIGNTLFTSSFISPLLICWLVIRYSRHPSSAPCLITDRYYAIQFIFHQPIIFACVYTFLLNYLFIIIVTFTILQFVYDISLKYVRQIASIYIYWEHNYAEDFLALFTQLFVTPIWEDERMVKCGSPNFAKITVSYYSGF